LLLRFGVASWCQLKKQCSLAQCLAFALSGAILHSLCLAKVCLWSLGHWGFAAVVCQAKRVVGGTIRAVRRYALALVVAYCWPCLRSMAG
jgi:hypothetical protein